MSITAIVTNKTSENRFPICLPLSCSSSLAFCSYLRTFTLSFFKALEPNQLLKASLCGCSLSKWFTSFEQCFNLNCNLYYFFIIFYVFMPFKILLLASGPPLSPGDHREREGIRESSESQFGALLPSLPVLCLVCFLQNQVLYELPSAYPFGFSASELLEEIPVQTIYHHVLGKCLFSILLVF